MCAVLSGRNDGKLVLGAPDPHHFFGLLKARMLFAGSMALAKSKTTADFDKEFPMSTVDVVRAWKDEAYRLCLSQEELLHIPPHPAGSIELPDADFSSITNDRTTPPRVNGLACCGGTA